MLAPNHPIPHRVASRCRIGGPVRVPSPPDRRWLSRVWPLIHDNDLRLPQAAFPQWRSFGTWFGSAAAGCGTALSVMLIAR